MSEKEVTLFFNFQGTLFSKIFDTSKTERAKPFPSFSHKPNSKQDDMSGQGIMAPGGGGCICVQLFKQGRPVW